MNAKPGIATIVVGVDGSDHSAAAVMWAARMAKGMGSQVVAVYVVSPPVIIDTGYPMLATPVQLDPKWREEIKAELENMWCRPLQEAGVSYQAVMVDGRPSSKIVEEAERVDADVVVVGRRGRGGMAELLLGSVSHELVLHCKRPVLVVSSPPGS